MGLGFGWQSPQLTDEEKGIVQASKNGENPFAYYYRGVIHKAYGNYEAAETDLQNAVNLQPLFTQAKEELITVKGLVESNKQEE